jgi:hypothetical protein
MGECEERNPAIRGGCANLGNRPKPATRGRKQPIQAAVKILVGEMRLITYI